jgi:ribulose kinase
MVGKNPLLMQQFADIFGRTIYATTNGETGALGSAIMGAVAAGVYTNFEEACEKMAVGSFKRYDPDEAHREDYEKLYARCHKARVEVARLQQKLWDM